MMTPTQIDAFVQWLIAATPVPIKWYYDETVMRRKVALRKFVDLLPKDLDDGMRLVIVTRVESRPYVAFTSAPDESPQVHMTYLTTADIIRIMIKLTPPEDDGRLLSKDDMDLLIKHHVPPT